MKTDRDGKELHEGDEVTVPCQGRRRLHIRSLDSDPRGPKTVVVADDKGNAWGLYPDEVRVRVQKRKRGG